MKNRTASALVNLGIAGIFVGSALVGYEDYKAETHYNSYLSNHNTNQLFQEKGLDRVIGIGGCLLMFSSLVALTTGLAVTTFPYFDNKELKGGEEK